MVITGTAFEQRSLLAAREMSRPAPVKAPQRSNWYEAGLPLNNFDQSYVPSIVQDARFDQNFVTRRELMRMARWLAQNNPFIKRILEVDSAFTVGANGLHTASASDLDPEWGKRANEVFAELCMSAGFDGEELSAMFKTALPCERTDGEIFILKTSRKFTDTELAWRARGGSVVGSRPCLQLVEAHRVQTPFGRWNEDGDTVIDGCEIRKVILPNGVASRQKVGFWVQDSWGMWDLNQTWTLVPLQGLLHIGDAQRANQIRYISAFYASLNITRSFNDLQKLEMAAAKDGAEKSTIIKTPTGEIQDVASLLRAQANNQTISNDESLDQLRKRNEFYQRVLGGRTLGVKIGDEVTQYLNNRPTVTSREYWLYLISVICAGLGVSVLLVFPDFSDNTQGTAIRSELDIANQLFLSRGKKWRKAMSDIWEYFIGWAIYNDKRVVDPPADWRKVKVFSPRRVNVDPGRDSTSAIARINAGMGDYGEWYGNLGEDWQPSFDRLAQQQAYAKKIGLTLNLGGPSQPANQQDDPPAPKKSESAASQSA